MVSRFHSSGYNPVYYIQYLTSICFNNHVELPCNPLIQVIGQMWYMKFKNLASESQSCLRQKCSHLQFSAHYNSSRQNIILWLRLLQCFPSSTISMSPQVKLNYPLLKLKQLSLFQTMRNYFPSESNPFDSQIQYVWIISFLGGHSFLLFFGPNLSGSCRIRTSSSLKENY